MNTLYQLLNPIVFLVFAAGFLAIHQKRTDQVALVAAIAYVLGAISFLGDLIFPVSENIPVRTLIAGCYAGTAIFIIGAINLYYRRNFPWRVFGAILVVHLTIYTGLLIAGNDWIRSLSANFGCGLIFLLGTLRIRSFVRTQLDKWLYLVGLINAAACVVRPIGLIILTGGTLSSATHDEGLIITTLHLFLAVSAVLTAMSFFIVLSRDIFKDLETRSESDPLTGLLNRRGFEKYAKQLLEASTRTSASLAVIDLDHFKSVNDTHGHAAGDDVIRTIADLLKRRISDQAIAARLGGEEFVVLTSGTSLIDGKAQAEAIKQTFGELIFKFENTQARCTASIGIAQHRTGETIYGLLSRADEALYLAKSDGRNCVKCEVDMAVVELKRARMSLQDTADQIAPSTLGKRHALEN